MTLLIASLGAGGCNLLDTFHEPGQSNDPEVLLQDAELAMRQNNTTQAVEYLEKAHQADPQNPRVRIKLATAKMVKNDVGAMDLVMIARKLNQDIRSSKSRLGKQQQACSFPQSLQQEQFDPTNVANFDRVAANEEVLREVQALVDQVIAGTNTTPEEFSSGDIQAAIERLRDEGLTESAIAEALLTDAVAHATLAYLDVARAGGDQFTYYFVTPPEGGERYVGYCAPDEETLMQTMSEVACYVNGLDFARALVAARADLLDAEPAREISQIANEAFAKMITELGDATCSAAASVGLTDAPVAPNL